MLITIKHLHLEDTQLNVDPSIRIDALKEKMLDIFSIHIKVFMYEDETHKRERLKDERTLLDYGIHEGSVLECISAQDVKLKIRQTNSYYDSLMSAGAIPLICVFGERQFTVYVKPKTTVSDLKWQIAVIGKIPFEEQNLSYNNSKLEDEQTLENYGINYRPRAENDRKFNEYDAEIKFYEADKVLEILPRERLSENQATCGSQKKEF